MTNPTQPHGPLRSFGRLKSRPVKPRQQALLDTLLPEIAVPQGPFQPLDLMPEAKAVWLEIGFGGGEHLLAEAAAHPATGFIGCEPYINGMAKILAQIDQQQLTNIRLFAGDAAELLAWLPQHALRRIDLIHPDPWPKRRHWKRRFVQDQTIAAMVRVLTRDGEFRFVSDIDHYNAWTLAHFQRSADFLWTAEHADDWRKPWAGYTMTRYGRKAEREGRKANYLIFARREAA